MTSSHQRLAISKTKTKTKKLGVEKRGGNTATVETEIDAFKMRVLHEIMNLNLQW